MLLTILPVFVCFSAVRLTYAACECGWRLPDTDNVYTHRIVNNFSLYPDVDKMLTDDKAKGFREDWMLYDYWQRADNREIRLDAKYDHQNIRVKGGELLLQQKGYDKGQPHISMSGLQTRRLDIVHGTFRAIFKDDRTELDIEIVTKGNSLVNNTINWTTHPALDADGLPIANATRRLPLSTAIDTNINVYREHRFDCDGAKVSYFLDGKLMHEDDRAPEMGGNLQLKLWADGNKWWSGQPSKSTVTMAVKSIVAYFNITSIDGRDECSKVGGAEDDAICEAEFID